MRTSDTSIVDALSRIAETFGRLVVQHIQLLRSEVESEASSLADKGRAVTAVVARAAPFILAGLTLASAGVALLIALALEPVLGRAAVPCALLFFGAGEASLASWWLKKHLPPLTRSVGAQQGRVIDGPKGEPATGLTTVEPPEDQGVPTPTETTTGKHASPNTPSTKAKETLYGAVGRA